MLTKRKNLTECFKKAQELTDKINSSKDKDEIKILKQKRRRVLKNV